ncbi:hypothetical protein HPB52_011498 [Rhipicephalus sanguineus]|uniref:Uncharacterized protein n=1 Tax=Rhipicephalus sanguineus TaxID=34632 RepID=A0A9D4PLS8_RHISA|nr:hypothetical protein HPB52_011498 [Rhipicephalus sanguineus]
MAPSCLGELGGELGVAVRLLKCYDVRRFTFPLGIVSGWATCEAPLKAAQTSEAPLKELDHMGSSDLESSCEHPGSETRGSPAASPIRRQRRRRAEPARKTPAKPARGAIKAAASKDSEDETSK